MRKKIVRSLIVPALLAANICFLPSLFAQDGSRSKETQIAKNNALESELESVAIIDRKVMIPMSDGNEEFSWIAKQPWSNGKVGTIGCSSTAEWQLAVTTMGNPADAAFVPMGFGAGVGRVGPYYEQGNWYRGGAVQMLFIDWLYDVQNSVRPMFPGDTSQADLIKESRAFDLDAHFPPVDWSKALWHLPEIDIIKAVHGPKGIFADHMPGIATGGAMIERAPNDPAWYKGGLWNDSMKGSS